MNTKAFFAYLAAAMFVMTCSNAHARFLSVDPVKTSGNNGANFNRYWYANNNPYLFTDPDGRAAVITYKQDGSISIAVPINYSGPGASAANTSAIASDTASTWSGQYFVGGSATTVSVSVVGVDANTPAGAINNITLTNGPTSDTASQGASFVNGVGGTSGEWNTTSPGMGRGEGPHEVGHLMGARDRYSSGLDANGNRTTAPDQGYSGNIMGELNGTPDSRTINEVLSHPANVIVREPPPPPPPPSGGR